VAASCAKLRRKLKGDVDNRKPTASEAEAALVSRSDTDAPSSAAIPKSGPHERLALGGIHGSRAGMTNR